MEALSRVGEWKSWRSASACLREWRGAGEKRSDLVLRLGARLLKDHSSRLGAECRNYSLNTLLYVMCTLCAVWDVHEQVCVAAMECGDMETAEVCLNIESDVWDLYLSCTSAGMPVPAAEAVSQQCTCTETAWNDARVQREVS